MQQSLVTKLQREGYDPQLHAFSEDAYLIYVRDFVQSPSRIELDQDIAWEQQSIRLFGRQLELPRLTAWYGDPGTEYTYSGLKNSPHPWTDLLQMLRLRLENQLGLEFNSVLCNRYANGEQYQGYHADDERELGGEPWIASLSFGARRKFLVKPKRKGTVSQSFFLDDRSLLIMGGTLQRDFVHALPRMKSVEQLRINLTFRKIIS